MRVADGAFVVTGGASGLGAATSRALAGRGAAVLIADVDTERGRALTAEIGATFLQTDVTDMEAADAAAAAAAELAPLRGLVNCAGHVGPAQRLLRRSGERFDPQQFERVVRLNLFGTFMMIRAAAPLMAEAGGGVVVNVSSLAGLVGPPGGAAYAASKAGVVGLTKSAARDLAPHAIRVVAVAPGAFRTPLFDTLPVEAQTLSVQHAAFPRRAGHVDEFADLVMHIVENDYLNAEVIRIDAGNPGVLWPTPGTTS